MSNCNNYGVKVEHGVGVYMCTGCLLWSMQET